MGTPGRGDVTAEEKGVSGGPWRPEYIRLIKIAIVAVIVIVALVIAIPIVQDALRQPRVTLAEPSDSVVPCSSFVHFHSTGFFTGFDHFHFVPPQVYTWSFTLVNTGDADGFVNIAFSLDGVVSAHSVYLVPAGSSIEKSFDLDSGDCVRQDASMGIEVSWKA